MNPFITVQNICKTYDGKQMTPMPISFKVDADRPLLLVEGDNGTGKTTLINIIIGAESASGGKVAVSEISDLTILFQRDGLLPHLSVADNLRIVAPSSENINKTISKLGLSVDHLDYFAKNLSGGEERRVQLARLYISERAIWVLDEPTSHTDSAFRCLLVNAISEHIGDGGICIFVTHDRDLVLAIRKRVLCMLNVVSIHRGQKR